jgi:hypothetical protein
MGLVLRRTKGFKLTSTEMDNNLKYLEDIANESIGTQGYQGLIGTQGFGSQGPQGLVGLQGPQGLVGLQGTQGFGSQGLQGLVGSQGSQGTNSTLVINVILYSEFLLKIRNSELNPWQYYNITDFRTCYDQPNYDYNGNPITTGNYKFGPNHPIVKVGSSKRKNEK